MKPMVINVKVDDLPRYADSCVDRGERAKRFIDAYGEFCNSGSEEPVEQVISDFLADLMHYVDTLGEDTWFGELAHNAEHHHDAEVDEENFHHRMEDEARSNEETPCPDTD